MGLFRQAASHQPRPKCGTAAVCREHWAGLWLARRTGFHDPLQAVLGGGQESRGEWLGHSPAESSIPTGTTGGFGGCELWPTGPRCDVGGSAQHLKTSKLHRNTGFPPPVEESEARVPPAHASPSHGGLCISVWHSAAKSPLDLPSPTCCTQWAPMPAQIIPCPFSLSRDPVGGHKPPLVSPSSAQGRPRRAA